MNPRFVFPVIAVCLLVAAIYRASNEGWQAGAPRTLGVVAAIFALVSLWLWWRLPR